MAITIHEFSTGIRPDRTTDGGWVSRGFTSRFMNSTVDPIPHEIERSIANFDFSITEGTARDEPAFIGRIIASQDQQRLWSVVAIVSRGKDEMGRSAPFFRYFFVEGEEDFIPHILAWFEEYKVANSQYPIFNPFDQKTIGKGLRIDITPKLLPQMTSPLLNEPAPMIFNEYNPAAIHELSMKKVKFENQQNILAAWAYNVEAVERPRQFTAIRAASDASYNALSNAKEAMAGTQPRVIFDEESVKTALKGITNSPVIKDEHFQDFAEALADQKITDQWPRIFNSLGAKNALDRGIYNSQMIKLLILQSVAIPDLTPVYVKWINKGDLKSREIAKTFEEDLFHKINGSQDTYLFEQLKTKLAKGFGVMTASVMSDKVSLENLLSNSGIHFLWHEQSGRFVKNIAHDLDIMGKCFQSPGQVKLQAARITNRVSETAHGYSYTNDDSYQQSSKIVKAQKNKAHVQGSKPSQAQREAAYNDAIFMFNDEEWKSIRRDVWNFWCSGRDRNFCQPKYLHFAEIFEKIKPKVIAVVFYDVALCKIPRNLYDSLKFNKKSGIYGMTIDTDKNLVEKKDEIQENLLIFLKRNPFFYRKTNSRTKRHDLFMRIPIAIIMMLLSIVVGALGQKYIGSFLASQTTETLQDNKPPSSGSVENQSTGNDKGSDGKAKEIATLVESLVSHVGIPTTPLTKTGCVNNVVDSFFKKVEISTPEIQLKDICGIVKKYVDSRSDSKILEQNVQKSLGDNKTKTTSEWETLKKKIIDKRQKLSQSNFNNSKLSEEQKAKLKEVSSAFQESEKKMIIISPELYKLITEQNELSSTTKNQSQKPITETR